MFKDFMLRIFSITGRINRITFLAYLSLCSVPFIVCVLLELYLTEYMATTNLPYVGLIPPTLFYLLLVGPLVRRSHDMDYNGWLAMLVFVPIFNLTFLVTPGTAYSNNYGDVPPPSSRPIKILAFLYFLWPIVGIWALTRIT